MALRGFLRLLRQTVLTAAALALLATAALLYGQLHARSFRLVAAEGELRVQRGSGVPGLWRDYVAQDAAQRATYAPLELPPPPAAPAIVTSTAAPPQAMWGPYEDLAALDRALFALASGWAVDVLAAPPPVEARQARRGAGYVRRLELLPNLSEAQRATLRELRGRYAQARAGQLLQDAAALLGEAQEAYGIVAAGGAPAAAEAEAAREALRACLTRLRASAPAAAGTPQR